MDVLFLSFVLAAIATVTAEPKAIQFGVPTQVQALRPRLAFLNHLHEPNITEATRMRAPVDLGTEMIQKEINHHSDQEQDDDYDDDNDLTAFSPNSLTPWNLFKLEKRTTRDCGVFVMDCVKARSACNNACYYQNCVKKDSTLRYQDFGNDQVMNAENRVDAGTTISRGTPCKNMPLSQRMYDTWPNWHMTDPELQTDEWPMAATQQLAFSDLAEGTVRNTLRCIPASENGNGGRQYRAFRRQESSYSPKKHGKYANKRTCDLPRIFRGDETYTVEFDLSGFETDEEIQEVVPYCRADPDCTNDGRQFHLSTLRYVTSQGKAGRMSWIYDLEIMNNYKLTGEEDPIESFQVVVKITGDDRTTFTATVSKYRDGNIEEAGIANNDNLATQQTLTVSGLPRDLHITPKSDDRINFIYGDPAEIEDRLAWFSFNTDDKGYDNEFDGENRYCKLTTLTDDDGDVYGQQYECWFPGW